MKTNGKQTQGHLIRGLLAVKETWRFTIRGVSMKPFMHPGDLVECKRIDYAAVAVGDVIIYESAGKIVVHRVLKKQAPDVLRTKGDNCVAEDLPVSEQQLLGIVVNVRRGMMVFNYRARHWKWINSLIGTISPYRRYYKRLMTGYRRFGHLFFS